jgi:hypothetical protein
MPLEIWTEPTGYNFGIYQERSTLNITLPADIITYPGTVFKVISGQLPRGTRIVGNKLAGTPFEVSRTTTYNFVIRATKGKNFSDRTFSITIEGEDEPNWLTLPGRLPIGSNKSYFIIDSSFIDFQLDAVDSDTAAGQQLSYFIASGDGELPPGLILLPNGRITGFIQPLLSVAPDRRDDGTYDSTLLDEIAYDFGIRSTNGYDTYVYDLVTYDFSVNTLRPRKLNRNYEFEVTITDGDSVSKRRFRIFVVGDDFFRADNVIMQAGAGTYTADVTYVRYPVFTTPSYLGIRRASNYQTFKIDIYEGLGELGPVIYELSPTNALIEGVCRKDQANDNRAGSNIIRFTKASAKPKVGYKVNFNQEFIGSTPKTYTITAVDTLGADFYRVVLNQPLDVSIPDNTPIFLGTDSILPPGMQFDIATGEIFGFIPFRNAITERFTFTVKAIRFGQGSENNISRRVFTVDIIGEIESAINWITDSNLGIVNAGHPSTLSVKANTTLADGILLYKLESGSLPAGLNLSLDGEIVGKVNQIKNQNSYKSYWKPVVDYNVNDLIKLDVISDITSVIRRQNIASIIVKEDHKFRDKEIVKSVSSNLDFSYPQGVEISIDKVSLTEVLSVTGNGPFRITFGFDQQQLAPLAPSYISVKGIPPNRNSFELTEVSVKATSGQGTGAKFLISKVENSSLTDPIYNSGLVEIILLDPGQNYLPGDTITISGSELPNGGADGVNDLTFTLATNLNFWYKINGNSNSDFNGRFFAVSSTRESITLSFETNPGEFGTGLISVATSINSFEAQTQLSALSYINYPNAGSSINMVASTGILFGEPIFYQATVKHVSDIEFTDANWRPFKFSTLDRTLTSIDKSTTTFDNVQTLIDREYVFTIKASDQLGITAVSKLFKLKINVPNETNYSNLYARPFLKQESRSLFKSFINDPFIFDAKYIYRAGDSNFGIQKELKSLIFAGLETVNVEKYISVMGTNNKPKRFKIGNVKKAVAKDTVTQKVLYEVVYLDLIDPLEKDKKHLPFKILTTPKTVNITADNNNDFYMGDQSSDRPIWNRPIPLNASIDRTDIIAGDPGTGVKFSSSISIWRKRLRSIANASRERNYLPLWMRSIQEDSVTELDYVAAIPLCYCNPGGADEIMLNIKNSQFDFKLIDYTVDRYIIDSVEGYYEDKYLVFKNDRTNIV